MMRVIALICEIGGPDHCVEQVHDFAPRQPIACLLAAGPELARLTPEGWQVVQIRCLPAPSPAGR